jgi:hypothetical protein
LSFRVLTKLPVLSRYRAGTQRIEFLRLPLARMPFSLHSAALLSPRLRFSDGRDRPAVAVPAANGCPSAKFRLCCGAVMCAGLVAR